MNCRICKKDHHENDDNPYGGRHGGTICIGILCFLTGFGFALYGMISGHLTYGVP